MISLSLPQPVQPSKQGHEQPSQLTSTRESGRRASSKWLKSLPLGFLQNTPSSKSPSLLTTKKTLTLLHPSLSYHQSRLHGYLGVSSQKHEDIFDIDNETEEYDSRSLATRDRREPPAQSSPRPPGPPAPPTRPRRPWPPPSRSPKRPPSEINSQEGSEKPEEEKNKNPAREIYNNKPEPAPRAPLLPEVPPSSPPPGPEPALGENQLARRQKSCEE